MSDQDPFWLRLAEDFDAPNKPSMSSKKWAVFACTALHHLLRTDADARRVFLEEFPEVLARP